MDELLISTPSAAQPDGPARHTRREGFPGQRMRVLPRPLVAAALAAPVTAHLLVTDVGFFPRAASHGRTRPHGAAQHVVIVCTAGSGTCELPGGTHTVGPGEALVIPAGTPHRYESDDADPWTIWWVHVVGRSVPEHLAAIGTDVGRPVVGCADVTRVTALLDTVLRRMEQDESPSTLVAASGAAWHALALLAAERRYTGGSRADSVAATVEHLRADPATRVSLGELAGMAGLSRSHFSALFRRATGYGPLEYQTRLRMGRARELLDTTDRTVASIAHEVGYADPLYFSRQFRRIHGVTATDHRARDQG